MSDLLEEERVETVPEVEVTTEPEEEVGPTVITIGEPTDSETPPEPETKTFKELRTRYREQAKELRALKAEAEKNKVPAITVLPPRPTHKDAGYDDDNHAKMLDEWYAIKQKVDDEKNATDRDWTEAQKRYADGKTALAIPDYDDAEHEVAQTLSQAQQTVLLSGSKMSAELVYALGKNPDRLQALAKITDVIKFAFAVADFQKEIKVTKGSVPAPERRVTGTAPVTGSVDSVLARLQKEADISGNRTKVAEYLREQKKKGK